MLLVLPVPRGLRVNKALLVLRAPRASRGLPVPKAPRVNKVPPVLKDLKVSRDPPVPKGLKARPPQLPLALLPPVLPVPRRLSPTPALAVPLS